MNRCIIHAVIVLSLLSGIASPLHSEDVESPEKAQPTKLALFQGRKGTSLALGQENVGKVGELSESLAKVSVDVIEIRDLTANTRANGVILSVNEKKSNSLEVLDQMSRKGVRFAPELKVESWTGSVFVDQDEIAELLKGLDYVSKGDSTASKLANWEVRYQTRGFFRACSQGSQSGVTGFFLTATGNPEAEASLSDQEFEHFKALIMKAQQRLDTLSE